MAYWLMKSEPDEFSIDDLENRPNQTEPWDGVRNYQARNMLRDEMQLDDLVFFYHSNCAIPGIVGIMRISRTGYVDDSAFDPDHDYYDSKSSPDEPRWFRVNVQFVRQLIRTITLKELKEQPGLSELALVQRGNRLSIMPVTKAQWDIILGME